MGSEPQPFQSWEFWGGGTGKSSDSVTKVLSKQMLVVYRICVDENPVSTYIGLLSITTAE